MTPTDAIGILKSQPVVVLDEQACRNAEDDEPMAVVIIEVSHRDAIVRLLEAVDPYQRKPSLATACPQDHSKYIGKCPYCHARL